MSSRGLLLAVLFLAPAVFESALPAAGKPVAEKPVKVYLLAGQSNMDGYGGLEALEYQATRGPRRKEFAHLLAPDGSFARRDDVWIVYGDRKGPLSAGYGVGKNFFGVEWEFGNAVGDYHDAAVLIVKTSWGGASIRRKFRPPSSGKAGDLIEKELQQRLAQHEKRKARTRDRLEKARKDLARKIAAAGDDAAARKKLERELARTVARAERELAAPKPERADIEAVYGANYRRMIADLRATLADIESVIPGHAGQGWELAGFVWFQGFNDQFDGAYREYDVHLANLIRDVRKELHTPGLPVVIGQMGHGGTPAERARRKLKPLGEPIREIKARQAKVAAMEEFRDTVALVPTDVYWDWLAQSVFDKGWREHLDEWRRIGAHFPYHYLGSPYFFMKAGRAFGDAMVELQKKRR